VTSDTPKPFLRPALEAQMQLATARVVERITQVTRAEFKPSLAESILRKVMSTGGDPWIGAYTDISGDDVRIDGCWPLSPAEAAYLRGLAGACDNPTDQAAANHSEQTSERTNP
jgi:hypothetical protein